MKILITGGAGFVGSTLTEMLLSRGHKVVCLDLLQSGADCLLPFFRQDNFELIHGDIRDRQVLTRAVIDADAIVHLAALVGYPACKRDPEVATEVNINATKLLNEIRSKTQLLLFASTGSIYGAQSAICSEDSPIAPLTHYARTKAAAERILMDSDQTASLRFATGFGLSHRLRVDLLVNQLACLAAQKRPLVLYEAHFARTLLHVRDMARSILFTMDNWKRMQGQIFNCGDERLNVSKLQVAKTIQELTGCDIQLMDCGKDEDKRDYYVSYAKIRELGFQSTVSLEEGITELIRAFRYLQHIRLLDSAARGTP